MLTIVNATDGSTHRKCSRYSVNDGSVIVRTATATKTRVTARRRHTLSRLLHGRPEERRRDRHRLRRRHLPRVRHRRRVRAARRLRQPLRAAGRRGAGLSIGGAYKLYRKTAGALEATYNWPGGTPQGLSYSPFSDDLWNLVEFAGRPVFACHLADEQ